ncbi:hypothetical protein ACS5PU_20810 [Pedobacter sp. GSP4]|uniref:hypothetical protein n=1 Tax=Pedobacter sp. GSP4 TaxID=3453716 RepID=UPI003EEFB284
MVKKGCRYHILPPVLTAGILFCASVAKTAKSFSWGHYDQYATGKPYKECKVI